jgi:amidase
MGLSGGLPIGLSFIGSQWHDHQVLKAGYAYEQISKQRATPTYKTSLDSK